MNLSRAVAGLAVTTAVALGVAGCGGNGPGAGEARLDLDGRASITTPGKGPATVSSSRLVHAGEEVRLISGRATLELGGSDAELDLRPGTKVEVGRRPSLVTGQLLASAPDRSITIRAAHASVTLGPGGAARLEQRLSFAVGSYRGGLRLASAGRVLDVPALRQAAVAAAGVLPDRATPLTYSPADAWDRAYLGPAMRLGDQLLAYSRGFTLQLEPGQGTTHGFYRLVLPELGRAPDYDTTSIDPARPPGETLVGAAITVKGRGDSFRRRWDEVFGFRTEGATWGLVALDQSLTQSPLDVIRSLGLAIGRAPLPFLPTRSLVAPSGTGAPSQPAAPQPQQGPAPAPGAGPVSPPPSTGTPADPVAGTAVDTVNDLLSKLPAKPPVSAAKPGTSLTGGGLTGGLLTGGSPTSTTIPRVGSVIDAVLRTPTTVPQTPSTSTSTSTSTTSTTAPAGPTIPKLPVPTPLDLIIPSVSVPPITVLPTTVPPTTLPSTTLPRTTLPPTTLPPTTLPPTTLPPTTLPPTTLPPTTLPPTTLPPITLPPTTLPGGVG